MSEPAHWPPSYLSCASLAHELDVGESTVHELVNRGVLPKPYKFSSGVVRWSWSEVTRALGSFKPGASTIDTDPYMQGARSATKKKETE